MEFDSIEAVYDKAVDESFLRDRTAPTPEELLADGVLDSEVQQALDALPEEYRTVVVLALVEEMSYKEIAAALSIPLGTVMSRLHRGRKMLQKELLDFAERKGIIRTPKPVAKNGEGQP